MATQPGRETRDDLALWGLAAVVALYAAYVAAAGLLTVPALDRLDAAFPFTFFDHLEAGEADGPIGDPMRLAAGVWLQLLGFWLVFAPLALRLRAPPALLVALTVLDEPIVLSAIATMERWAAG